MSDPPTASTHDPRRAELKRGVPSMDTDTGEAGLGIYALAKQYDLLFEDRDFSAECDFLAWCAERHGTCEDRSFLELGCGPARHAREMARRGYRATGLDLGDAMLSLAREEANREGLTLDLVRADMTDFTLPRPVGLAACMLQTVNSLLTNEQMTQHLRAVAANLLPGGVYVIETVHPRKAFLPFEYDPRVTRRGDTEVELLWGLPEDPHDTITQVFTCTRRVTVRERGEVVARVEESGHQRYYLAQELRALIDGAGGFAEAHWYGELMVPAPTLRHDPAGDAMLVVLVKGR